MKVNLSSLLFTCEHGGNRIPPEYVALFNGKEALLESHRGYDPGALEIAKSISSRLNIPLIYEEISRLVVEQNRSRTGKQVFSEITCNLPEEQKRQLLSDIYDPYHGRVEAAIDSILNSGKNVIHISFHSFTPVLNGEVRNADIGLLYDPSRILEKEFCKNLKTCLLKKKKIKIRYNYPYLGTSDGLTTILRKKFSKYCGIELEINQKHFLENSEIWEFLKKELPEAIETAAEEVSKST